jgi:eukaryotic-like serine/threonine-protein kinase
VSATELTDRSGMQAGDETLLGTRAPPHGELSEPTLEIGRGTEIGRYLLVQELGRGATGRVWAAYDGDLDRKVAIKLVAEPIDDRPERRKRLLGEAQAMAKIRHPNVVLVHDVGTHEGRLYIAMEFVEGTTLGRWCAESPRSTAEIVDAYLAAARGLAAAHAVGLVHRDFKPDNVLVDGDARVRVADFGLAEPIELVGGELDRLEQPSHSAGTPAYMSPEHHTAESIDARSDQFSFCVALFEALAGQRPYRGRSLAELAAATVHGELDQHAAAKLPARLRRVILRGLAVRPDERYATMDELIAALDRARRPRWPRMLAAASLVLALGAGGWVVTRTPADDGLCTTGLARVRSLWNDRARDGLRLAQGDFSAEYSRSAEQRMVRELDAYGESWAGLHDEVCLAASAPGAEDDPLAAPRRACVEDRFASFAGVIELVDARTVPVAAVDRLLAALPPQGECRRDDVSTWEPVPAEPELAARVGELRSRLRETSLSHASGNASEVDEALRAIVDEARATDYPHLIARALAELAIFEDAIGRSEPAREHLDEALALAVAAGHDWLAATIAVRRVEHAARNPVHDLETDHWSSLARALLEHSGGDDRTLGELCSALTGVMFNRGEFTTALEQSELAGAAFLRAVGPRHRYASTLLDSAYALSQLGRADEALQRALEGQREIETALGREHPEALRALHTLALLEGARGDTEAAITRTSEILQRAEHTFGPHSRSVSNIAYNLAYMQATGGHIAEARASLELSRTAWPVKADRFADAQFEQTEAEIDQLAGDPQAALLHLDRAIELYSHSAAEYERPIANARLLRAGNLQQLGRSRETLAALEEVYAPWRKEPFFTIGTSLDGVLAALALGDSTAVALWLARMETLQTQGPLEDDLRRIVRTLAAGDRSAAALARLRSARDRLVTRFFAAHPLVQQLDAWIAGGSSRAAAVTNGRR